MAWNGHARSILNGTAHHQLNSLGGREEPARSAPSHEGEMATHDMTVPPILQLAYTTIDWRRIYEMDI